MGRICDILYIEHVMFVSVEVLSRLGYLKVDLGCMDSHPSTSAMFVYKPCNHLFLFIGRVAAATQNLCRRRQEVKAVVFEVLIDQRHQDLGGSSHN